MRLVLADRLAGQIAVTGEDVAFEDLGGARTHNTKSGVAHYMGTDEEDAIDYVKALLSYLPSNNLDPLPALDVPPVETVLPEALTDEDLELDTLIPDSPNQPYDMHELIAKVLDDGDFFELQPAHAANIVIGFGRDAKPEAVLDVAPARGRPEARRIAAVAASRRGSQSISVTLTAYLSPWCRGCPRRRAGGRSSAAGRLPHGTIQRGCRRSSSPGRYQYPVYQRPARAQVRGSTADE